MKPLNILVLAIMAFSVLFSSSQAQVKKTQVVGNWSALEIGGQPPSVILVRLQSTDQRAIFAIGCQTRSKQWQISFTADSAKFTQSGEYTLGLRNPAGKEHAVKMTFLNPQTLYALHDRDPNAVSQAVTWFADFPSLNLTLKSGSSTEQVAASFQTKGAAEATKIPFAACKQ